MTASQLLKVSPTYFSTLSTSLDKLIGYYVSGYTPPHGLNLKGRGHDREDSGSIRPGAILELSAPPGGGKTGAVIGIAMSARILDEEPPEVLIVGELSHLSFGSSYQTPKARYSRTAYGQQQGLWAMQVSRKLMA